MLVWHTQSNMYSSDLNTSHPSQYMVSISSWWHVAERVPGVPHVYYLPKAVSTNQGLGVILSCHTWVELGPLLTHPGHAWWFWIRLCISGRWDIVAKWYLLSGSWKLGLDMPLWWNACVYHLVPLKSPTFLTRFICSGKTACPTAHSGCRICSAGSASFMPYMEDGLFGISVLLQTSPSHGHSCHCWCCYCSPSILWQKQLC